MLMQAIEEISEQASREWSIEKALDKMHADWQELNFELAEWKATGTHILRGGPLDEAQTLLDDHIIKSRAMSASPFAKPFAADILPWVTRLTRLNAILEQWLTCQVTYCAHYHPVHKPRSSPKLHCCWRTRHMIHCHKCLCVGLPSKAEYVSHKKGLHKVIRAESCYTCGRASGCTWSPSSALRRS